MCTSIGKRVAAKRRTQSRLTSKSPRNRRKGPGRDYLCSELGAILISLNGDFADIINYPPANFGGIIALQVRNHPESPAIVMRLLTYLGEHPESEDWAGKLFLAEAHRIRIKD